MEAAFDKMKSQGKNSEEGLMQWLKEANIVDGKTVTQDKAQSLFADVGDKSNVDFSKFKQILSLLATLLQKPEDQLAKSLAEVAPKLLGTLAVGAGASALKSAGANAFKSAFK